MPVFLYCLTPVLTQRKDRFKPWDYHYDAEHDQLICRLATACGTLQQTGMEKGSTAACQKPAAAARAGKSAVQVKRARKYSSATSGRNSGCCRGDPQNRPWQGFILHAQGNDRAGLRRRKRKTRHALYPPLRPGPRHKMVKLKFAAMNLKKLAIWSWKAPSPFTFVLFMQNLCFVLRFGKGSLTTEGQAWSLSLLVCLAAGQRRDG